MKSPQQPKKTPRKNNAVSKKSQVQAKTSVEKPKVKAYDDADTDAFIREVSEEVHNDTLKVFWNKYGLFIILFVVLAVSAAVGFETIKGWRDQQYQAKTENYLMAVQNAENAENALKALEQIAAEDNGIYRDLARIQIANILIEQNRATEAEEMLNTILQNKEVNPRITYLAALKLATFKVDTAPFAEVESLLQPLIQANNSWTVLAQDLLAMAAIRDGNLDRARSIYTSLLQNPEISASFKSRIEDMLSTLNGI